jgi:hypothetical protein
MLARSCDLKPGAVSKYIKSIKTFYRTNGVKRVEEKIANASTLLCGFSQDHKLTVNSSIRFLSMRLNFFFFTMHLQILV